MHELTGPKRKNKLLSQNPDLERAQNGPMTTSQITEADKTEEKGKKRKAPAPDAEESKKRVHVVESSNVVEVVYDDSAPVDDEVEDTKQAEQPPASDLDWLRARTSRTLGLISDEEQSDDDQENKAIPDDAESIASDEDISEPTTTVVTPVTPPATDPSDTEQTSTTATKTKQSADEAKILRTGRLFIRNLVYGVTEDDLREVFSPYGPIEEVLFPFSPDFKQ
jgi:multiple RNA-binding domain-containing protein 1